MPLIKTANGPIWFADHRDPTVHRPATVIIHGAGGTHLDWPAEVRRLPEANAIVPDLPGHGRSPGPGRNSVVSYAADIIALLDALKVQKVVVAGHSMGGAIAQTLALHYPDRLWGLILIATGARLAVSPDILNGWKTDPVATVRCVVGFYYGLNATDMMRRRSQQLLAEVDADVLYGDYVACNQFDVRKELGRIRVPALIIGSTGDLMTPFRFSQYLHEQIAGSDLVQIEGAGHMIAIEQPDSVADSIRTWLLRRIP